MKIVAMILLLFALSPYSVVAGASEQQTDSGTDQQTSHPDDDCE